MVLKQRFLRSLAAAFVLATAVLSALWGFAYFPESIVRLLAIYPKTTGRELADGSIFDGITSFLVDVEWPTSFQSSSFDWTGYIVHVSELFFNKTPTLSTGWPFRFSHAKLGNVDGVLGYVEPGFGTIFDFIKGDNGKPVMSDVSVDYLNLFVNTVLLTLIGFALMIVPQAAWLAFRWRKNKLHLCKTCGYDISQSSGKCPECGHSLAI